MRIPSLKLSKRRALGLRLRLRRPAFDLRKAMFILPNLFTVASIFCGFYGAVTAAEAHGDTPAMYRACVSILLAAFFDGIDGRVARMTKTQSAFGVQMDSLADVISFGAAPALIAWFWGLSHWGPLGLFACFFFCACGAIRLARFNVMAAQAAGPSHFFVGLPIPAAAWLLVAVIIAWLNADAPPLTGAEPWPPFLLFGLGVLMVSTIPFRTFKASRMNKRSVTAIVTVICATLFVAIEVRPSFAVVALMAAYLAWGLGEWLWRWTRKLAASATGGNVGPTPRS
jgi:CDP-diacylglycerol--serine O-phosphatidyltransferase